MKLYTFECVHFWMENMQQYMWLRHSDDCHVNFDLLNNLKNKRSLSTQVLGLSKSLLLQIGQSPLLPRL